MPCPWLDGWNVLSDIAKGAKPWSLHWLWSQHGEHRIVIPRLLVWLDCAVFGAKNISLFVEIYAVQAAQLAVVWYVISRCTPFPKHLRHMLLGVFAFCLFHPYQAQNFTWAFQIAFVLPFAMATLALIAVAHFEQIPDRLKTATIVAVAVAPILAGMNLAAGLIIGPTLVVLAYARRLPLPTVRLLAVCSAVEIVLYAWGYRTPPDRPSPFLALSHPLDIASYTLAMLDASWHFFSIGLVSLVCLTVCSITAARSSEPISNFEYFCFGECALCLATATMIACGRLHFGIHQAAEGRYQTIAVLYWAAFFSVVLIRVWRSHTESLGLAQVTVVAIIASCGMIVRPLWTDYVRMFEERRQACAAVLSDRYSKRELMLLDHFAIDPASEIRSARKLLVRK
ncbi:MAG: hypothetical protein ACJ74Y_03105 [Bryobacteraceae bacterium]